MSNSANLNFGRGFARTDTSASFSMYSLIQDFRFSVRLMLKRPGMTAVVFAALIFGMGLNIAIFAVLNAVLLRPLPIFQPDRLVWLRGKNTSTSTPMGTSYPDFLDWTSESHSFDAIAAMNPLSFTLTGNGQPKHVKATGVSASWFKVWGVTGIMGRDFSQADDRPGAARVVILTHGFWQREFGGDIAILGKSLALDGRQYTVIGVLEPTKLLILDNPDVYVAHGPLLDSRLMERDTWAFVVFGRLKRNVTQAQALADMQTVAGRIAAQFSDTHKDVGVAIVSMNENLTADGRKPLRLLVVAACLIFLLAAVNVLIVSLASTFERGHELGVRLAVGAPKMALLRQLLAHAFIFAAVGGAAGLLLAKTALLFFLHRFPDLLLRFRETTVDMRVMAMSLALTFITTLLAGLVPAIYVFHLKINSELRTSWPRFAPSRFRLFAPGVLIVSEVALALGLSVVSVLLIKSFYEVEKIDLGFNPQHVFSFQVNLPSPQYKDPDKQIAFYKAAVTGLAGLPGMQSASGTSGLPLTPQGLLNTLEVDAGSPLFGQQIMVDEEALLPGFCKVMRLPVIEGRDFTAADHDGTPPVTIIDEVLAAELWPHQDPIRKRIRMSMLMGMPYRWLEVVGVVREIKHFGGPEGKVRWMQVYVPQYQDPTPALSFVMSTMVPEAAARTDVERTLHYLDKDLPVEKFESMDAYFGTFLDGRKVGLWLLTTFAAIGILLGMIGIYGVVDNAVTQRRREVAIRLALGATRSKVIFLVARFASLATLGGILIGSGIVMSLARLLASVLYGVTALDAPVYIASVAILLLLAIAAGAVPTMRLLRFNIQEILRQ